MAASSSLAGSSPDGAVVSLVSSDSHVAASCSAGLAEKGHPEYLRDVKQLDQALVAYRKAREMNPNIADAHLNEGLILQQQGNTAQAVDCYRKVAELVPDNAQVHHLVGLACHETGTRCLHVGEDAGAHGSQLETYTPTLKKRSYRHTHGVTNFLSTATKNLI